MQVTVSSAKLKRKKNWFGTTFYTELTADGEIKKTAKSSSSSNPKWDEQLTVGQGERTVEIIIGKQEWHGANRRTDSCARWLGC